MFWVVSRAAAAVFVIIIAPYLSSVAQRAWDAVGPNRSGSAGGRLAAWQRGMNDGNAKKPTQVIRQEKTLQPSNTRLGGTLILLFRVIHCTHCWLGRKAHE